ncbi:MAG: hypothetical protein R3C99_15980 [Pirellulaceae bacterium]
MWNNHHPASIPPEVLDAMVAAISVGTVPALFLWLLNLSKNVLMGLFGQR